MKGEVWKQLSSVSPILSLDELKALQKKTEEIFVHDSLYEYIVSLVEETRSSTFFSLGASPRAAIALLRMSRAMAMLSGRDFVTAKDIQNVLVDVLGHRVRLSARARAEGVTVAAAIQKLYERVKTPKM